MEFTRQAWGVAGLALALTGVAVLLERPLLLGGAAVLGGWLLARQWQFLADATRTADALTVTQSPAREQVTAGESVAVTLGAGLSRPSPLRVSVTASPPVGTEAPATEARTVSIDPGDGEGSRAIPLDCPIAGRHEFGAAGVVLADRAGLFRTEIDVESDASVTAVVRAPDSIHVGEGGDRVAAFGAHRTGDLGPGLEPAELREYVPGDSAADIDWKATARLGEPYVREHEIETDRRTLLVVDHRASMAAGPPGERKLDYVRQVALAYLDAARRDDEAIGLLAVGDDGISERLAPETGAGQYERLAQILQRLGPTGGSADAEVQEHRLRSPSAARRAARDLDGDTAFERTLAPFYASAGTYVERIADDPLFAAVESGIDRDRGATVSVLLTDDDRPGELRQAADAAVGDDDVAVVFLAPSALFDQTGAPDLDDAYERYVEFEEYRRDLAARPGVTAYEVAPQDRIEAVLAARRPPR